MIAPRQVSSHHLIGWPLQSRRCSTMTALASNQTTMLLSPGRLEHRRPESPGHGSKDADGARTRLKNRRRRMPFVSLFLTQETLLPGYLASVFPHKAPLLGGPDLLVVVGSREAIDHLSRSGQHAARDFFFAMVVADSASPLDRTDDGRTHNSQDESLLQSRNTKGFIGCGATMVLLM